MAGRNKIAVITGATGGLGTCFAHQLAEKGYDMVITGRRYARLHQLAADISMQYGVTVRPVVADFTRPADVEGLLNLIATLPRVDMLVSNAGYGEGCIFEDEDTTDMLAMVRVHVDATLQLVHAVLPIMRKQRSGYIISVSSLSAFMPAPGSSIYAATKGFLNTFMESLQMEVRRHGIMVQSLCPGLTHTGFHDRMPQGTKLNLGLFDLWMSPSDVVNASLKKLGSKKVVYVPGFKNKMIVLFTALLPRSIYLALAERVSGKLRTVEAVRTCHKKRLPETTLV